MTPSLLDRVADRVLRDSLRVRGGESVTIETWNTGLAFAERTVARARQIGAMPVLLFEDEDAFAESVRRTPKESAGKMGKHEYALLSRTNAYVFIPGPVLGGSPRVSREAVMASTAYNSSWYKAAKKARLRGVRMTFGYVGPELAKILHKPLNQVVEHQLTAALTDLHRVRRTGLGLSKRLKPRMKATLRADGDTLHFDLGNEEALDDGKVSREDLITGGNMVNVPPGYYAREIVGSSLDGVVHLYAPMPRIGTVADLRLGFDKGRLRSWESEADQRWLNRLVDDTPKERRTLDAVVIGLNPALRYGYGQDRLVEGAVTFSGMFQGTTQPATLEADGRTLTRESVLVPESRA